MIRSKHENVFKIGEHLGSIDYKSPFYTLSLLKY